MAKVIQKMGEQARCTIRALDQGCMFRYGGQVCMRLNVGWVNFHTGGAHSDEMNVIVTVLNPGDEVTLVQE